MKTKIVKTRKYHKQGYEIRDEIWDDEISGKPIQNKNMAYNLEGEWIGDSKWAFKLSHTWGIYPQKSNPEHCVCSIGFSKRLQKWFGWSHRVVCGFGIGDKIFEKEYGDNHTPLIKHGNKLITSMEESKLAASNFGES